jgi:predicted O-methyltransferase YrrM
MTPRHPLDGGIYGYMLPEQLDWLRAQAKKRFRILELGAYLGRTTVALARATPGIVHVVDHWKGSTDPTDECPSGPSVKAEFLQNVSPLRNVKVWEGASKEVWRRLSHLTFDMVWIDADHTYPHVHEDIRLWKSYLSKGGLLAGHDGDYPEVERAVRELVPGYQIHNTEGSWIWWKEF